MLPPDVGIPSCTRGEIITDDEKEIVRKATSILNREWKKYNNEEITCYRCKGRGKYTETYEDNPCGYGVICKVTVSCPKCDVCNGTGRIKRKQDKRLRK
jgi:hypothetical protein